MISIKGTHFIQDIILTYSRWYLAYLLSCQHGEELMEERGVSIDHFTIHPWARSTAPQLQDAFHSPKHWVWISSVSLQWTAQKNWLCMGIWVMIVKAS